MDMTSLYGLDKILNTGVLREEKVEGFQTQHVFFSVLQSQKESSKERI